MAGMAGVTWAVVTTAAPAISLGIGSVFHPSPATTSSTEHPGQHSEQ